MAAYSYDSQEGTSQICSENDALDQTRQVRCNRGTSGASPMLHHRRFSAPQCNPAFAKPMFYLSHYAFELQVDLCGRMI